MHSLVLDLILLGCQYQNDDRKKKEKTATAGDAADAKENDNSSNSTFKALVNIVEQDGVGALFAGVLPALVLVINPIIQYTIFEQIKNIIIAKDGPKAFTAIKAFSLVPLVN